MDSAGLAQAFNRVGQHLSGQGHRIVIRRARELVTNGELAEASRFLLDAATRHADAEVQRLSDDFKGWQAAGGQPHELITLSAWRQGAAAEDRVSDLIGAATDGDLPALVDEAVAQRAALADGEPLAAPSAPSAPPAAASGRHAIGNVFGDRAESQAVVEAPSKLQPRSLDLDDDVVDAADLMLSAGVDPMAATELMPNAAAAVRAATVTPPPPPKAPEADPFAALAAAAPLAPPPTAAANGGFEAPELKAPPSVPTPPPPVASKAAKEGGGMGWLIGAVVLAAAGAAAWFFLGQ